MTISKVFSTLKNKNYTISKKTQKNIKHKYKALRVFIKFIHKNIQIHVQTYKIGIYQNNINKNNEFY